MKNIQKFWHAAQAITVLLSLTIYAQGAFADASVKLFNAFPVIDTGTVTDPSLAATFATNSLVLQCPGTPRAVLSSTADGTGSVVVDNFLTVDGANVCTGISGTGNLGTSAPNCFIDFLGTTGTALTSYTPVPPLDISENLAAGKHMVTFELQDWGGLLASSDIWLLTNCNAPPQVAICHRPGTPIQRTLFVAQSAVPGHLGHGDTLGECL